MGPTKLSSGVVLVLCVGLFCTISAKSIAEKPKVTGKDAGGEYCVICEFLMNELEKSLGSNATEAEIEAALEKVCSLLPTTVQDECNLIVQGYTQEIIDLLLKFEDPTTICTQLALCTSSKKKADVTFPGPQCLLCKELMEKLEHMLLSNSTEDEIVAALEKVCSLLGPEEAECDSLVDQYAPIIVHLLLEELAPEAICAVIGLCSTPPKVHAQVVAQPKKVEDTYCALCEFIMKQLEDTITQNSTEAEIEAALDKVCSLLPSTIRTECDQFIDQYGPVLLNLLVQELSPDVICTFLKFCPGPAHHTPTLSKLKPVAMIKEGIRTDEKCVLCEYIMKEIDSLLSENATEEEITKVIENICTVLPGTLRPQCDSFLNTYGPVLITLIVQQLDPTTICTKLALCKPTSAELFAQTLQGRVEANPQECAFCEMILAQLKDLLSKNSTDEEIRKGLDQVCGLIPGQFSADCVLFVNRYTDTIIKLLLLEIDPTQICTAIQLCTASSATEASDDECDLCKILVSFADDFIRKNSTEEEIIKGMLDVCSILPSNIKDQCTTYVKDLGPYIVENIGNLLTPDFVCQQELGVCSQGKLGASLCSRGPATWCASMENAKLCNAVSHCKRHAWN